MANPPPDVGPVAFVALVPLLAALAGVRPRRGALLGLLFGLTYYGILLYWLLPFGVIAWAPLVASQAAFAALFGALAAGLLRRERPVRSGLAAAALWTAIDWLRGSWPLGGFTWGGLGYTQHANHLLLPLASVTGVWGITFVIVLVNALALGMLDHLRDRSRPRRGATAALVAVALVAVVGPALVPRPAATGPRLSVAVVQGNVPKSLRSDRLLRGSVVALAAIRLNRRLAADPPQLAVWPENTLAVDPTVDRSLGAKVAASIRAVGAPTIVGGIADGPHGTYYNTAFLYAPDGRVVARYAKTHLVPFGEYIPYPSLLGWTQRYRHGLASLSPGHRLTLFHVDGARVAAPICFENTFPNLFRRFVDEGANLVVVTTNDSSYGTSVASREHVIMSQLRAVENARWIVQAAISGESAIVDPSGRIVASTRLFVPAILRATVVESSARTIYTRLGDWFPALCALGAALAWGLAWRRRRAGRAVAAAVREIAGGAFEPRTLVVLPTYNERATVEDAVRGALAAGSRVEVLVVDDGSPDGTGELVAKLAESEPRVRLVERAAKQGLASAYLLGFREGLAQGFDVVVEMDADLSHRPADLPIVIAGAARFDLTIGSRYVPGGGVSNWSRLRLTISRAGNLYARTLLRLPVTDATSGFRAYRRDLLDRLVRAGIATDGYGFQIELVYRAVRLGARVGEVPITFQERAHGHSKFSRRIILEALWNVTEWAVTDLARGLRARRARRGPRG